MKKNYNKEVLRIKIKLLEKKKLRNQIVILIFSKSNLKN